MSEFDLIRRYFTRPSPNTILGVGDDAALLSVSPGMELAVSTDMLVGGTHFYLDTDPRLLGHKTLAVNLSDLAAMGAAPRWATLSLALPFAQGKETSHEHPHPNGHGNCAAPNDETRHARSLTPVPPLPEGEGYGRSLRVFHPNPPPEGEGTNESLRELIFTVDDIWLRAFSAGFFALAEAHGVELVGGDTTRGALNLCVTIMGEVPQGQALRRDGARAGDDIWVSGVLGEAALGLAYLQGRVALPEDARGAVLEALHQPCPHIDLGLALRGIAHSAIDVSDGLLADIGHILMASGVAAELRYDRLPKPFFLASGQVPDGLAEECILSGGDDYELCFTAPAASREPIAALSCALHLPLTRIGKVVPGQGCRVCAADGSVMPIAREGYDHFA